MDVFTSFIPPYFHPWHLPVVFLAGLIGEGYATAIGSGGVLIQFALAALGLPLANVVATDLAGCMAADFGILAASTAPRKIWRNNKKLFFQLSIPLTLGGLAGTFFLVYIPATILKYVLIAGLSLLLLHVIAGKQKTLQSLDELHISGRHYPLLFVVLLVLGTYGNISGVGSLIVLPAELISLVGTALAGLILWPYCLTLWIATFIGANYMTKFVRRVPNGYLRALLIGVVALYLIWLLASL